MWYWRIRQYMYQNGLFYKGQPYEPFTKFYGGNPYHRTTTSKAMALQDGVFWEDNVIANTSVLAYWDGKTWVKYYQVGPLAAM